ncbi:MAG: DUF2970 domain-containing protein [Burkholderiales bacterium]
MAQPRQAGPLEVAKTVFFGLIGIRRKADHERVPLRPLQVIAAGLVLAALFVFTLVTVVRIVAG